MDASSYYDCWIVSCRSIDSEKRGGQPAAELGHERIVVAECRERRHEGLPCVVTLIGERRDHALEGVGPVAAGGRPPGVPETPIGGLGRPFSDLDLGVEML